MIRFFIPLLGVFLICVSVKAQETYDVITPLSFGSFAITSNDSAYHLTVSPANDITRDSAFVIGPVAPTRGETLLEGLPVTTDITVFFDNGVLQSSGGGGPVFTVTDFTVATNRPPGFEFQTDGAGRITLYYGATLRSSGNGNPYSSGAYTGSYDIIIDF